MRPDKFDTLRIYIATFDSHDLVHSVSLTYKLYASIPCRDVHFYLTRFNMDGAVSLTKRYNNSVILTNGRV
jgi:hypothetical protein